MKHSIEKVNPGELASHIQNALPEYSNPDRAYQRFVPFTGDMDCGLGYWRCHA
jgi:hypothetical protein